MDENTQAKFEEKIKELVSMAKKQKNILEYQEVSDFFEGMALEEDQMERVLDTLERNNVDVLRMTDGDDDIDPEEIILSEIRRLTAEKTVIMISHDIEAALSFATHILSMGRELFFGTRDEYISSGRAFFAGKGGSDDK